ncbi:MAG: putative Na+/H+ antiporter [Spartobacteria bacterium]
MKSALTLVLRRALPCLLLLASSVVAFGTEPAPSTEASFPTPLEAYSDDGTESLGQKLVGRIKSDPFNIVATVIFFAAIIHTFAAAKFSAIAHKFDHEHEVMLRNKVPDGPQARFHFTKLDRKKFMAVLFHFLGEVEAVFGIWLIPLTVAIITMKGVDVAKHYVNGVNFTEPIFVVVIMAMASSRPIMHVAEASLKQFAKIGSGSPAAWWLAILTVGPILGSFITEPAAMTICALLLAAKFFPLQPSMALRYATLGMLFVNISIGGTLTHFAAPPVVMVATRWDWDTVFMLTHFGWKSVLSIVVTNALTFIAFRKELVGLRPNSQDELRPKSEMPSSIIFAHLLFIAFVVYVGHYAVIVVFAFLFFLAYVAATERNQDVPSLRSPVMVGFFLAGLVVHGGLQTWWIQPVLTSLNPVQLMLGATFLTSFNDNAALTYLASLVPNFSDAAKHAIMQGAVAGGGLTVIANAPNPAGQSILQGFFGPSGVNAFKLFLGAAIPTAICVILFLLLP